MKNTITITIILLFASVLTFSQQTKIDSLMNVIKTTNIDTIKLNAYTEIASEIMYENPDSNKWLFDIAIPYAIEKKHDVTIASLYNNRGVSFGVNSQYDSSIKYLEKAVIYFEKVEKAKYGLSCAYNNLGNVYREKGYYNVAFTNYFKAIELTKLLKDTLLLLPRLDNIAASYFYIEDYNNAKHIANQSFKIYQNFSNSYHKVNNLITLGAIYEKLNILDSALQFIENAEKISLDKKYNTVLTDIYNTKGEIYKKLENFEQALQNYEKSLNYCNKEKDNLRKFYPLWGFQSIYFIQKKYNLSEKYLKEMLFLADSIDNLNFKKYAYKEAYIFYKQQNNLKESLTYLEQYKQWSDSIFNKEKFETIGELSTKYESEKKDAEILKNKNEIQLQKAKNKVLIFTIIGSFILILLLVTIFIIYRLKQKNRINSQKIEIQEAIKQEFRSVLHTELSSQIIPIRYSLEDKNINDSLKKEIENLNIFQENLRKQSSLFYIPDFIDTTLEVEISNLIINYALNNLKIIKNIDNRINWGKIQPLTQQNIYRITQELLNNSLKHSKPSEISFELVQNKNFIKLNFIDNGKGYNPSEIVQNFGYKNEILARVDFLKAKFTDQSQKEKGTNLIFEIPMKYGKN